MNFLKSLILALMYLLKEANYINIFHSFIFKSISFKFKNINSNKINYKSV